MEREETGETPTIERHRRRLDYSFVPIWKPDFVSDLVPEDRCHLNGLAVVDGRPRYVTALGRTDTPGGWREKKANSGVVLDVTSQEVLLDGLSMPHSPRWYAGRLWVLNSGAGELLSWDPVSRRTEVIAQLPGYLRGLSLVGPYAVVGMSKIREKHIFGGLPIQERCPRLACGVAVVDTRTGQQVALFEFTTGCEELYDVQFLPDVRQANVLNLDRPVVYEAITNPESSFWLRPSQELPGPSTHQGAGGEPATPGGR